MAPYAFIYAYYSSSYLKMSSSETDTVFAIAPEVTNALNSLIFQFKIKTTMGYAMNYTSTDDYVTIGSMSNPSDASTFVPYSHVDLSALPSYGYGTYTFDARYYNIPASHHHFAIRVANSKDAYCIDDIEMISAGGCGVPQMRVGVTTDQSAELHLLHTPSTSTLQIAVRSADHSYNDTTSISSDSLYLLTGLMANTEYFATIRGICTSTMGNDTSAWTPEVNFYTTGVAHLGFPYYCDFEETTENSAWSLFTGGLSNYWTVGTAVLGRKEGTHGLYISEDGINASFNTSQETFTWATRMIHFTPGAYTIAFKAKAGGTTGEDYMRAFLVESDQNLLPCAPSLSSLDDFNGVTLTSTSTPAGFLNLLGVNQSISNKDWQEYTYELLVTEEKDYQLAYLWVNNAYYGIQPGAAVDSISIALNTCAQPSGITITYAGARNLKAIATGVEDDASIVLRFGVMPKDVPMDPKSNGDDHDGTCNASIYLWF